jgi:hypothetical protein
MLIIGCLVVGLVSGLVSTAVCVAVATGLDAVRGE